MIGSMTTTVIMIKAAIGYDLLNKCGSSLRGAEGSNGHRPFVPEAGMNK